MQKVLYIFIGDISQKSGVTTKLAGIFNALKNKGVALTVLATSSEVTEPGCINGYQQVYPVSYLSNLPALFKAMSAYIQKAQYDLCIFRYPNASKALLEFMQQFPNQFVLEHNTKEVNEINQEAMALVKKYNFRPSPSYLKLWRNAWFRPVYTEKHYGRKILRLAKSGIAVTHEIAAYEQQRFSNYKCNVVANGIDVEKINFYKRQFKKGDVLNLLLLVNTSALWHGTEMVIDSLNQYQKNNIRLFLVGKIDERVKEQIKNSPNIVATGHLPSAEYQNYLKEAHVGIGSLALYRIGLEEASPLKVREYLASGLPVMLGYRDPDLAENTGLSKYALPIDTRKGPIDWEAVYNWAVRVYQEDNANATIRQLAYKQIDFSNKVSQLLAV